MRLMLALFRNWWSRPCGGREVLALALPMIISYGMWAVMHLIDRLYLVAYSSEALAAALAPGMMQWALICLPLGIAGYANTFVAQYYGAGHHERIGRITWQGIWISLATLPVILLAEPVGRAIFALSGHTTDNITLETSYFVGLSYGAPAIVLNAALSAFFTGRGKMKLVMAASVFSSLVNIALDYVLIFGKWGAAELGVYGAGVATSIANWSGCLVLAAAMLQPQEMRLTHLWQGLRFDWPLTVRLMRYGAPSGLPMLIEAMAFSTFVLFVSRFSNTAAAATNLAFNINAVAFVPMIGIGIAVQTLVGQNLAAGKPQLAERATWTALTLGLAYQLVFASLYLGMPELFLVIHSQVASGEQAEQFEEVRLLTQFLLRFVAAYCLFDAMQIIFIGALKGAGDTLFIMFTVIVISCTSLALGYLGEQSLGWQVIGWWSVLTVWIFALGMTYLTRFVQGRWKTMRVIEPEVELDADLEQDSDNELLPVLQPGQNPYEAPLK
jgi:MATE family multidrug resistance protein